MHGAQPEEGAVFSVQTERQVYIFGNFRLDVQDCRLWHGDISISLPPKTFDILHVLIQNAGQLIEKKALLHAVWPNTFVEEGNLSVHISALRKIFNKESPECEFIETVPRRGYRFTAPVTKLISGNGPLSEITDSRESVPQSDAVVPQNLAPGPYSRRTPNVLARVLWDVLAATLVATVFIVATTRVIRNRHQRPGLVHATSDSRPLTSEPGVYSWPTFSPDGSRLAYSWRSDTGQIRNIYIQSIGSDSREKLSNDGRENFSPAWSPTGREIAFLHTTKDPKWLEVKIAEVGTPHTERHLALIDNIKSAFHDLPTLNWSPGGAWLVTTEKDEINESSALELISVENGKKEILTHPPALTVDVNGAFSPRGDWLAFIRARGPSSSEIHIIPAHGGPDRHLPFEIHSIDGLTWSADGQSLIVASSRALSVGNLWKIPLNGDPPVALSTLPAHTADPVISSVSHRLAYVDLLRNGSLWRISADGHSKDEQLIASRFIDSAPDYSPDGSQIAFESDRTGASEIWISRNDGTQCKRITNIFGPNTSAPRWAPDGSMLAFDSGFQGRSAIFVVNASGGVPIRVTTGAFEMADNLVPSWSGDGKFLYFSSNRTGRFEVWRKELNGDEASQITQHGGYNGLESANTKSLYYIQDTDKATIWRIFLDSGESRQVAGPLGPGMWGYWAIAGENLYYLQRAMGGTTPAAIFRMNLKTGAKIRLGQTQLGVNEYDRGLAVSPDGRWLLYAQRDVDRSSIMLVDNWY
ncbi:MAG TPA: winged helix-turn-helix domain-containing protein [Acidobacteriaceae bacterium]|jgi:Tol biopolymer transport system component/DNA-binding winged helix-turn-helix (wHTH) protein